MLFILFLFYFGFEQISFSHFYQSFRYLFNIKFSCVRKKNKNLATCCPNSKTGIRYFMPWGLSKRFTKQTKGGPRIGKYRGIGKLAEQRYEMLSDNSLTQY